MSCRHYKADEPCGFCEMEVLKWRRPPWTNGSLLAWATDAYETMTLDQRQALWRRHSRPRAERYYIVVTTN
jgi:hypothetical protein